jgi:hypothetical protein
MTLCAKVLYFKEGAKGKSACPYGVPIGEIAQVQDLQLFLSHMFRHLELNIVHL